MKYLAAASFVLAMCLGSSAYGQDADALPRQDTYAATWHFFSGASATFFKPLGDHPNRILVGWPDDWEIRGWDISFGARGKTAVDGPMYLGGGLKFLLGGAEEHFSSDTNFTEETVFRLGAESYMELGVRMPAGRTHHLDLGVQLGATGDYGNVGRIEFDYWDAIVWVGPVIAIEPNAGGTGVLASASLRLPAYGTFELRNDVDDVDWDATGGYLTRVELGYVFSKRFTVVGYGEFGGYEFRAHTGDFDQERWSAGLEIRMSY